MTFARYRKTTDQTFNTTNLADVTDLTAALEADETVEFEVDLIFSTPALTTGIRVAVNGPASPGLVAATAEIPLAATSYAVQHHTGYNQGTATTGVPGANASYMAKVRGVIRNGPNAGNLVVRVASEVAGSAVTVRAGSVLRIL